jgi:hypothetical protein
LKLNEHGNRFEGYGTEHNWTHKCGLFPTNYLRRLKAVGDRIMPSDINYF